MLTVVLSLLFGVVAFVALAQIGLAVGAGFRRGRLLLAELAGEERAVKAKSARRRGRSARQPALAAA